VTVEIHAAVIKKKKFLRSLKRKERN